MFKRVLSATIILSALVLVPGSRPAAAEPLILTTMNVVTVEPALIWTCMAQSTVETTIFMTITSCDADGYPGVEPVTAPGFFVATGGRQFPHVQTKSSVDICMSATATLAFGGAVTETQCESFPV